MGQIVKIALQADVGGFVKNFSSAENATGKFGAALSGIVNVGGAVGSAIDAAAAKATAGAKKLAAFGVGSALSFGGMGVAAAKFEGNMLNVQTLLDKDLGTRQIDKMGESVLNMSRRFPQSAGEISKGLYNIASSGFAGADGLKVLEAATMAASAGLTSVEASGSAITSVLNAYGQGAEHVNDVSDTLFQTVNLGVVSFEQLTGVIGDVVGTAAAAGVSFAQVGAAIATMTLSGISADEAGTSLNRLLQSMIDPSESLGAAFRTLGYSSGASALEQDGLRVVMEKLRVASNGNIETLLQWFPEIRAARGALALMSAEGNNYARVSAGIDNAQARAGATLRAFNIQAQGTGQAFQRLLNSLQAAAIGIGQYFLPPAKLAIEVMTALVNVVGNLPGPIKAVIGYAGMLGSVMLALGGIFLAWRLKTMVANVALETIGKGLQTVGTRAGAAGAGWTNLGSRLQSIQGPFGITRAALGGLAGGVDRMGGALAAGGTRVVEMGSRMGGAGNILTSFGTKLQSMGSMGGMFARSIGVAGNALSRFTISGASAVAIAIGLFSALTRGKQEAQDYAEAMTKTMDKASPDSMMRNMDKVAAKASNLYKELNSNDPSDIFGSVMKNIGDLATNIVGMDIIKDSSWDKWFKAEELSRTEEKILKKARNMQKNLTEVFNDLNPSNQNKGLLGLDSKQVADFALIAKKAGIDVTDSFTKSEPARTRLIEEIRKAGAFFGSMGVSGGQVTDAMINQFQKMEEATAKAGKGAADAYSKSFDLFKSVDPKAMFPDTETLIPIGTQIEAFYTNAYEKSAKFYGGIQELQSRGLDPSVIGKFLQAGPEAAGDVVQAAVEDSTNGLVSVLNNGEKMLGEFQTRAAEMARLTQRAIMDPKDDLTKQLPNAMAIANETLGQGNLATTETVAAALSMDPASVQSIANNFGITLAKAVPPAVSFGPGLETQTERLKSLYNALDAYTQLPTGSIARISEAMDKIVRMPEGPKKASAVRDLYNDLAAMKQSGLLNDQEFVFAFSVVNAEVSKQKIKEFMSGTGITDANGFRNFTQAEIQTVMSVVGQPDAVAKLQEFATQAGLNPRNLATLLEMLGTEESIAAAVAIRSKLDEIDRNPHVTITASDQASGVIGGTIGEIHRLRDLGPTVVDIIKRTSETLHTSANGNIFKNGKISRFASGGEHHVAQYAKGGDMRLWAEPETGGESYIPWASSKRGRSTQILAMTAKGFGYTLVPMAAGGVYAGAMAGRGAGGGINVRTELTLNGPTFGVDHLEQRVHQIVDERDRELGNILRMKRE